MFSLDRDTAIIAAVVICIAATLYMYREFGKTKNDLYEMKNLVDKHDSYIYSTDDGEYEDEEDEEEVAPRVQENSVTQTSQMNAIQPVANTAQ